MTARTVPVKLQGKPAKPPKPPGRLKPAARRRRGQAARAALPYATSAAIAAIADLTLHQPEVFWLGLGAAAGAAALRLQEAHGWHRAGGKGGMPARRRYQGTATRKELPADLSPQAAP